ncbi:MAG: LysE family translocator [Gammaproteobacteria bacterium]|nr:LysE family translocator [Gammaproteobacteria bacterium]
MIDLAALASTGLAFFIVAVSPGPATISNAAIAMSQGRKTSLIYGAGLSCGLVFWGVIAATGMGAVLQGSLYLLLVLKVLGGLYLLWLAYQSGQAAMRKDTEVVVKTEDRRWFLRGLVLNMSNPKSVIAWMAALSLGLGANSGTSAVIAATLVCIIVGFVTNALYSVVFSVRGMMLGYRRFRRNIDGFVAALFTVAGLGLIRSAISD